MVDVSSRSLQVRLLILVFLAFIPALGIFWYANREFRNLQLEAKEDELIRRAEAVATEYQRLITEGELFLGTLSEFDEVRSTRFPTCTEHLARVLQHTDHFTFISVIGMDGYLACGSLTPESALFLGDRAYYVRAMSRQVFSVGEFSLGRVTGKPVLGMALPMGTEGMSAPILATSLDLNVLAIRPLGGTLPEGYTFSVLDPNKRVLVRLPQTGDFSLADSVGAIAGPEFPGPPEGGDAVIVTGTDFDGIERLFAVAELGSATGGTEGYLAIGRTRITLMQEVDEIVRLQLRFLAVGGVVLLALAWALGHFWLARCPPGAEEGEGAG
ncbi:MAG: hypothetical protein HKO65_02280 [Gemmatimonadetes bacterium]|nr:hypothetical protein [Gemmatimonadota bacterium]NNM03904.1 hypothetical protein [Gemmatimonadota bacterium]